jgi:hypothetical protein
VGLEHGLNNTLTLISDGHKVNGSLTTISRSPWHIRMGVDMFSAESTGSSSRSGMYVLIPAQPRKHLDGTSWQRLCAKGAKRNRLLFTSPF